LRLLFVGGDFIRKGGDILVDVFRNDLSAVAELDIVTRNVPVDLPDHVRVHQNLSPNDGRLRDLYAQCDVFVLPTRADMSSLAAIEAMATGRPVIASPVGGIPDIVSDGVTGFLVPSQDKSRLRDCVLALAGNEQLRHRMGRAGRERVERQLNAETEVARMLATLRSVIDQRRRRAPGAFPS
jgi:glycosyltransferase involved in cell wall biosynthesis